MKFPKFLAAMATFFFVASAGLVYGSQAGSLRVGAAKADISPPADMFPFPPAASRGTDDTPGYTGIHDPLYVRVIMMDNGLTQAVWVTFDLDRLRSGIEFTKRIAETAGVSPERVFIAATHTHNAPKAGRGDPKTAKLEEIIQSRTLDAVRAAKANLQLARMGYGTGKAYVNTNRDKLVAESKIGKFPHYTIGYNPDGPSEKTVYVLKFESLNGEPIAFFINYAVHGVVMFSAKTKDGMAEVSGDLPGATSRYVESRWKDKVVAMWTSGAAADQNPLFMATYNQAELDRTDLGAAGYAILEVLSRRLGEEVLRVSDQIKADASKVTIAVARTTASCPGASITRVPNSNELKIEDAEPVTIGLRILIINDVVLACAGGEIASVIGQNMKKASPLPKTIFVTHAAEGGSYTPDDASYPKATFEVFATKLKPGCAENAIVDGLVRLIRSSMETK